MSPKGTYMILGAVVVFGFMCWILVKAGDKNPSTTKSSLVTGSVFITEKGRNRAILGEFSYSDVGDGMWSFWYGENVEHISIRVVCERNVLELWIAGKLTRASLREDPARAIKLLNSACVRSMWSLYVCSPSVRKLLGRRAVSPYSKSGTGVKLVNGYTALCSGSTLTISNGELATLRFEAFGGVESPFGEYCGL